MVKIELRCEMRLFVKIFRFWMAREYWGNFGIGIFMRHELLLSWLLCSSFRTSSMRITVVLQCCWPSQSFLATFKEELDGFVGNPCQIMLMSSSGQKRKDIYSVYVFKCKIQQSRVYMATAENGLNINYGCFYYTSGPPSHFFFSTRKCMIHSKW